MTERPILMSAPMVRALLAGTKTQTRRVLKPAPEIGAQFFSVDFAVNMKGGRAGLAAWFVDANEGGLPAVFCPYGKPGDLLWVRETWARDSEDGAIFYRADVGAGGEADVWQHNIDVGASGYRWRPSIHMPRAASRITLEVTEVRVERLQDISEADARAEGMPDSVANSPRVWYMALWNSINGPSSWDANPWVWAVSFRHHHKGQP